MSFAIILFLRRKKINNNNNNENKNILKPLKPIDIQP